MKISFQIRKFNTNQFAVLEPKRKFKPEELGLIMNVKFGLYNDTRVLACIYSVTYTVNNTKLMTLELQGDFEISKEDFRTQVKDNQLNLPKRFAQHLAVITIGTARGVIHAKTENTGYNKYYLPTVNIQELVKSDLSFTINSQ